MAEAQHRSGRYIDAVRDLRQAAEHNRDDHSFGRRKTIVYILDANVVVHFLHGDDRPGNSPGAYSFRDLLEDPEAASVNDRLTTEYLFSGKLPGQNGAPLLMAGRHWNEALHRATAIAHDLTVRDDSSTPLDIDRLRGITDPTERFRLAERIVPKRILQALKTTVAMRRRLDLAFIGKDGEPARVMPLDRAAEYWNTTDLDRVRHEDFRDWRAALRRALQRSSDDRAAPMRGSYNLDSDALVLASIQALYRHHPRACNSKREVLFLLITADRGLLGAVRNRMEDLEKEGIPNFVRHPRVWSPILNFSSMLKVYFQDTRLDGELRAVFGRVQTSLDLLLAVRRRPGLTLEIVQLLDEWAEAARRLATVQVGFFRDDATDLREAGELLLERNGLEAATKRLRETIDTIGSEHSRLLSIGALRDLANRVSDLAGRREGREARRAPLQILGVDILMPVRDLLPLELQSREQEVSGLKILLEHISQSGGRSLIERIGAELQKKWQEPVSQLLAACIYIAADAYQAGHECALRAIEFARNVNSPPALRREAEYCAALATRFSLRTRLEFFEANRALSDNLIGRSKGETRVDKAASLRDSSERAALTLMACLLQRLEHESEHAELVFDPGRLPSEFDEALELIEKTLRDLEGLETPNNDSLTPTLRRLRLQLCANRVGGLNDRRIFGTVTSRRPFLRMDLSHALDLLDDAIDEMQGEPVGTIARINRAVGRVILEGEPRLREAMTLLQEALNLNAPTYIDQREFAFLAAKLPSLAAQAERDASAGSSEVAGFV